MEAYVIDARSASREREIAIRAALGAISLLLIAVATAACYFPARRAMKVEPKVALRQV